MMTFMIGHCEDSAASRFDATAMHREPEVQDDMAPFACTLTAHLSRITYLAALVASDAPLFCYFAQQLLTVAVPPS